ncbi:MAG: NAD-dependent epimerase/dehydratase family protein [Candidatus Izemoplasmatales bacterium]|nr:NAD-dependent epimerase/dehydratase family protein [Candidatus Izemoplasmatales bacterium]
MYVVTGATGHIGNTLVRLLIEKSENVKVLARQFGPALANLNVEIKYGDIFDVQFLKHEVKDGDIFIHMAGLIDLTNKLKAESYRVNCDGTKIIADFCLENKIKLIYTSSVDAIYKDDMTSDVYEPTLFYPNRFQNVYSASKAAGTAYIYDLMQTKGLKAIILYPSAVIGINDYKPSAAGKEIRSCFTKRLFFYIKGGYNFIDVRDTAKAIYQASLLTTSGSYILSGHPVTIRNFYIEIAKNLGKKIFLVRVPVWLARIGAMFMHDVSNMMVDALVDNYNYINNRMVTDLLPELIPFNTTVKDTISWFQNRKTGR